MILFALALARIIVPVPALPAVSPTPVSAVRPSPAAAAPPVVGITPVAERVAVIAALNKRNGQTQQFEVKPGNAVSFGGLTIRVRTCETAPPTEAKQIAAFLQIDEAVVQPRTAQSGAAPAAKRVFSGWMFAESPSLNPLTDPLYDVWVRSCTMRFPDSGPGAIVAADDKHGSGGRPKRSRAPKSPTPDTADANRTL